jgi:hypothetical protein
MSEMGKLEEIHQHLGIVSSGLNGLAVLLIYHEGSVELADVGILLQTQVDKLQGLVDSLEEAIAA